VEANYLKDLFLLKIQSHRWNPHKQVLGVANSREGAAQVGLYKYVLFIL
jgi:hypothetical protein